MDAAEGEREGAKARKRPQARAPEREEAAARNKNLRLSADACERLGIHAVKLNTSESALVEALIRAHLRRFVVSDRGGAAPASPEDGSKDSGASLAIGETLRPFPEGGGPPAAGGGEGEDGPPPAQAKRRRPA